MLLVSDAKNGISASTLYRLGFLSEDAYERIVKNVESGEAGEETLFSYADLCSQTFYLVAACDRYRENGDGTFSYIEDDSLNEEELLSPAIPLKIAGVIRPKEGAANANISTAVAYTPALTDYLIAHTDASAVIRAQEATPKINVLTGMRFQSSDNAQKAEDAKQYLSSLSISEKATFYQRLASVGGVPGGLATDEISQAAALDLWLASGASEALLVRIYDEYLVGASYEDNLAAFGKVSYDAPSPSAFTPTRSKTKNRLPPASSAITNPSPRKSGSRIPTMSPCLPPP